MSFSMYRPYFEKASMYKMLADYYRYNNPTLHDYYYKKHVKNLQKMMNAERSEVTANTNEKPAKVRVLHAIPNAPNVDIYVNGTRILKDFPYKKVTDYLPLPKGKYQIDVYPAGNLVSTLISRKVEVNNGKKYTLAAAGSGKNLHLIPFEDHSNVPQGEAKVRFVHLSPDTSAVDVAVKHSDVVFTNVPYRKATNYLGVTPMAIDLDIRTAGSEKKLLTLPNVQMQPNKVYSIYAIGLSQGKPPLDGLILVP